MMREIIAQHSRFLIRSSALFAIVALILISQISHAQAVAPGSIATSLSVKVGTLDAATKTMKATVSFSGATSLKKVSYWVLALPCPGGVVATIDAKKICGSYRAEGTGTNGNVSSLAVQFINYSGATQVIPATLTAYDANDTAIGTTASLVSIPATPVEIQDVPDVAPVASKLPVAKAVTILYPNGGESFKPGAAIAVSWKTDASSADFTPKSRVQIAIINDVTPVKVYDNIANSGKQALLIPAEAPLGTKYKIAIAIWPTGATVPQSDESDGTFSVGSGTSAGIAPASNPVAAAPNAAPTTTRAPAPVATPVTTSTASPNVNICKALTRNLGVGSSMTATESNALSSVFSSQNISTDDLSGNQFDENYAAAMVEFQKKYAIPATGFMGSMTRSKILSLNDCASTKTTSTIPTPSSAIDTSANVNASSLSTPPSAVCPVGYICYPSASAASGFCPAGFSCIPDTATPNYSPQTYVPVQTTTSNNVIANPVITPVCPSGQGWNGSSCVDQTVQTTSNTNTSSNTSSNSSSNTGTTNTTQTSTPPTATFLIEGQHSYTYTVGQTNHYSWSSTNADLFSSSYTSTGGSVCGSGAWVANSASGLSSTAITSYYLGCTWTVTYTATNSKTGQSASDTVVVKVVAPSSSSSSAPAPAQSTTNNQQSAAVTSLGGAVLSPVLRLIDRVMTHR